MFTMFQQTLLRLVVTAGPSVERALLLTGEVYSIGSGSDDDLQIADTAVAQGHLVIRAEGRKRTLWSPADRPFRVDGEPVEVATLKAGQVIAIGETQITVERAAAGGGAGLARPSRGLGPLENPVARVVIGIYLAGIVALGVYLGLREDTVDGPVERVVVERGLAEVETCLTDTPPLVRDQADVDLRRSLLEAGGDQAAAYHLVQALVQTRQAVDPTLVEGIVARLDDMFFAAWSFEDRHMWASAAEQYDQVIAFLPDIRCDIVQTAISRALLARELADDS